VALGGLTTGAFFMLGISAYQLLRGRHKNLEMFRISARIGLTVGVVSVLGTMLFGHAQGQRMADTQPMKLAAAEGLWESESPAGLSLFQIGNEQDRESIINIRVPSLLSFLTYNTPDGMVQGINAVQLLYEAQHGPGDYVPPAIWLTYWSFRGMVGAGMAMFVLALVAGVFAYRRNLGSRRWFLWLLVAAILLPYIANTTGWLLTEVGRQPWIVQGLMTVDQALSPNVTVTMLLISLIGFTAIYGTLMVADVYLLQKFARGTGDGDEHELLPDAAPSDTAVDLKNAY
jgi:cytochrome d ubiquinol oxidase subunit I